MQPRQTLGSTRYTDTSHCDAGWPGHSSPILSTGLLCPDTGSRFLSQLCSVASPALVVNPLPQKNKKIYLYIRLAGCSTGPPIRRHFPCGAAALRPPGRAFSTELSKVVHGAVHSHRLWAGRWSTGSRRLWSTRWKTPELQNPAQPRNRPELPPAGCPLDV